MRRERATRIGVCVLLLATVVLTGCRLAEHGRRAAIDAFASFVLDSVVQAPLTQPAPKVSRGQAAAPVLASAIPPPPADRRGRLSSIETLPAPRIVAIDLAPACRVQRITVADIARIRVEARMTVAEMRGLHGQVVRRIVVIAPEPPATL
jgi:hypothetical protein